MNRVARSWYDPEFRAARVLQTGKRIQEAAYRKQQEEATKQNATDVNPWRFAFPPGRPGRPPDAVSAQRRTLSLQLTGLRPKPELQPKQRLRPKQQRLHPMQQAQQKHQRRSQQQQVPKQPCPYPKLQRQVPKLQQRR